MFTVCPKCALTLVVTAADLRVAQGYVRCGRCSNVFNALNALSDERHEPGTSWPPSAPRQSVERTAEPETPHLPSQQPAASPPTSVALHDDEDDAVIETELDAPGESLEFDPASTSVEDVFVAAQPGDQEGTGTFEAIVLEGGEPESDPAPQAEATPASEADQMLEQELQSLAQRIEAQNRQSSAKDFSSAAQGIAPSAAETLKELGAGIGEADATEEEVDEGRVPAWAWRGGLAALVLLLLMQLIHHYRHDLAVIPQLNALLTSIYETLGVSLEPRWDVRAYEVRQLGAMTDPAATDHLIVRASVKNAAPRPQPLPLLRVAVQDRFGNRIATRDVAPASYVPRTLSPRAALASGQRVDVEMRFVDPGADAVGFEIDACLAAPGGGVNCANR